MAVAEELQNDLDFLSKLILIQGKRYTGKDDLPTSTVDLKWPELTGKSAYAHLVKDLTTDMEKSMERAVRTILNLALAPYIQPQRLDPLAAPDGKGREFTEYGRFRNDFNNCFLPSVQTALFIVAGLDLELRFQIQTLFLPESPLIKSGVLLLDKHPSGISFLQHRLAISPRWVQKLTTGREYAPEFGAGFPATRSTTSLDWEDLVLHPHTQHQVAEVERWLTYRKDVMADPILQKRIKPGYRALFYGPSGTGKTLTVNLLGKSAKLPVYRIDLSLIVSKYIGETEKNLSRLFREAEGQDWILFFDEADSLFGKRTNTQSAHDKYANQEVSYLLQKVEDHPGLIILASNFKSNIDEAFLRRFNAIIHFPQPSRTERKQLWEKTEPHSMPFAETINLNELAKKYELTGAHIVNIVHSSVLLAWSEGAKEVKTKHLELSIRKEYEKEGKVLPH